MSDNHLSPLAARPSATGATRLSALDGVRAVAVLIIMGFHFGVGWLPGGFFGVDIFYVLSGYLITGILTGEYRRHGRIKLSAFWLRRARRLLPALLIVLVVVSLMVRFAEPAGLYPDLRASALSALFYFSNWWQIAVSTNYFVTTGAVSPLTHTWSLAVEEQFYLVWPLVVLAVMTLSRSFARGIRVLLAISAAGAVASVVEMALLYNPTANITRLYFGTDTHAQSILIGAALACALTIIQTRHGHEGMAPEATSRVARYILIGLGTAGFAIVLILAHQLGGTSAFTYRGGFLLVDLSAASIILGAVCVPGGPVAWALSLRPLVWLGTLSYGVYLWHYPVFVYLDATRTGLTGMSLLALRSGSTVGVAALSFYLVERPVMNGTFWRSVRAVIPSTAVILSTVAVVMTATASEATALPFVDQAAVRAASVTGPAIPVLVTGDSAALTLGLALSFATKASKDGLRIIDEGNEGCGVAEGRLFISKGNKGIVPAACNPGTPAAEQWPAILSRRVHQYRPKVVVLLAGRWDVYDRTDLAGKWTNVTDPAYARYVKQQLQLFVTIVSSTGAQAVLMTAPYYSSGEQPDGQPRPEDDPARVRDFNRLVDTVASNNPRRAAVVDLNAIVCPGGHYTGTIGDLTVRAPDGVHFPFFSVFDDTAAAPDTLDQVEHFGLWLGPKVLPAILAAAQR